MPEASIHKLFAWKGAILPYQVPHLLICMYFEMLSTTFILNNRMTVSQIMYSLNINTIKPNPNDKN